MAKNMEVFPSKTEFNSILSEIFENNFLSNFISGENGEKTLDLFYCFSYTLWETNRSLNLTAVTDARAMILKHLADSLLISKYIPNGASVIDVGCGGGFPTFPLAIARPDLRITALDSTEKKINFVRDTASKLGLTNITPVCARAEELAKGDMRESFDCATARAVASLPILCELCLPFVKVGGRFVAMKSLKIDDELAAAKSKELFSRLGGESTPAVDTVELKDCDDILSRSIAVTKKISATPAKYPRAYAQIVKNSK